VTFLSREPASLRIWPVGAQVAVNHNTAEEILATKPDLILTDPFTPPALKPLLVKTGAKIVEVPPAESFAQIRAVTRQVAKAVGEEARGEALIARMDADLRDVAAHQPAKPVAVMGWGEGGFVPGSGGLFNAMLTQIGARNAEQGAFGGFYDLESLIVKNPDALVYGDTYRGMASLRDSQDQHPALLKRYAGRRVSYASLYGCGTPHSAAIARQLQKALSP
jgi:iron complex transport system substrate-binding protein